MLRPRAAARTLSPVKRSALYGVVVVGLLAVTSCGGSPAGTKTVEVTSTVTATTTATVTAAPSPVAATIAAPSLFPPGYPQVVQVSTLPPQPKALFEGEGHDQVVAVAPGVWAPLTPGTDPVSAATAGVLEGYCASIKTYQDTYLGGQRTGGSCY